MNKLIRGLLTSSLAVAMMVPSAFAQKEEENGSKKPAK